jgi:tryptophan-rich sensory protein
MDSYAALIKPDWAPAPNVFGIVWSILYPIIFIAYGYVIFRVVRGEMPAALIWPIAINLVANFAFTPIQFGLNNLPLAAADVVIVLVTIVWSILAIWPHAVWVALALVPYLVWVTIATVLQLTITWMNR